MKEMILTNTTPLETIIFRHPQSILQKDEWSNKSKLYLDNIKINVFMKGNFSVVVNDKVYSPVYADICVLAPHTLHYGQVPKITDADYFQIDLGMDAFGSVPEGRLLLETLIKKSKELGPFLRPEKTQKTLLINLMYDIEKALLSGKKAHSFALIVCAVSMICDTYDVAPKLSAPVLSKHIRTVTRYIEENFSNDIKVEHLAKLCCVSPSYLSRQFKKEMGVSIHTHLNNYRIMQSVGLLQSRSVADTAAECGFSDSSHYIATFKKILGTTPAEYSKAHK